MKLLKFIIKTSEQYKLLLLGMFFCTLFIAFDGIFRPYLIKILINNASNAGAGIGNNAGVFDLYIFKILAAVYLSSQMLSVLCAAAFDWLGTLYHTKYREKIVHTYLKRLSKYDYNFFQETQAGTITAKIAEAFNAIPAVVFMSMSMLMQFGFLVAIAGSVLIKMSYLFGIMMVLWILLFIVLTRRHIANSSGCNEEYAQCKPKIFGFLTDYFTNILNVWFFSGVKKEESKLQLLTQDFVSKSLGFGTFLRKYYFSYGTLVTIYIALIFVALGYLSVRGAISAGDFALVFMINYKIADKLSEISYQLIDFMKKVAISTNAIELLGREPKNDGEKMLNIANGEIKGEITFNNVSFSYYDEYKLFDNFNLTIKPKQKVGLVGFSGAGKTTIINLITRLQNPLSGKILIDGQDISCVKMSSLRENISLVSQDPSLFHRSIFENIACAKHNATNEEVMEVAKKAKVDEFVQTLPEKYNTIVGERGLKLSGGQRQRIAIARALLKNAPIFIMDEATSQLDSITESVIRDMWRDFTQGKTSIIVAHRLSTVAHLDLILVFDSGKIVQQGTHSELINSSGVYQDFWKVSANR